MLFVVFGAGGWLTCWTSDSGFVKETRLHFFQLVCINGNYDKVLSTLSRKSFNFAITHRESCYSSRQKCNWTLFLYYQKAVNHSKTCHLHPDWSKDPHAWYIFRSQTSQFKNNQQSRKKNSMSHSIAVKLNSCLKMLSDTQNGKQITGISFRYCIQITPHRLSYMVADWIARICLASVFTTHSTMTDLCLCLPNIRRMNLCITDAFHRTNTIHFSYT